MASALATTEGDRTGRHGAEAPGVPDSRSPWAAGVPSPAAGDGCLLATADFRHLRDFIYERSGLFFTDAKRAVLEGRVQRRLRALGISSPTEYLRRLHGPESAAGELLELLDVVATHETSFFRDRAQLDGFRRRVLPRALAAAERRRRLRIWSAACSSGEEPYTLAMIVLEVLGPEASRWDVSVLGTDLSRSMIARAVEGKYGPYSFRSAPAYYVQKYFEIVAPETFRVRPGVRSLVEFRLLNFADAPAMRAMRGYHVVFCRNALIYFDQEAKRRCVGHLVDALEPGGYLFVGPCETAPGLSETLESVRFPDATAYRKHTMDPGGAAGRLDV